MVVTICAAFNQLAPLDPEVKEVAGRLLVRRSCDPAKQVGPTVAATGRVQDRERVDRSISASDMLASFIGLISDYSVCRRKRLRSTPKGVNRLLRLSSARTIGSSDTDIRA